MFIFGADNHKSRRLLDVHLVRLWGCRRKVEKENI